MKRGARLGFGGVNLALAAVVSYAVFRLLPTRWWVVDSGGVVITALLAASGLTLLANQRHAGPITRVAGLVVLALGLALFAALCVSASWLHGIFGPVGEGGSALFVLVALLVFPYLVVYPAVLVAWVGPRAARGPRAPRTPA